MYLSNLHREVARPLRVGAKSSTVSSRRSLNPWISTRGRILGRGRARMVPVLKPRHYIDTDAANQYSLVSEWLADVVICYAIRSNDMFRFVTGADVIRWRTDAEALHHVAVANLTARLADQAGRGAAAGRRARDRNRNQGRVGVEPTPPSRPAPAVLRPPREYVLGRHPGSRYAGCLFRPAHAPSSGSSANCARIIARRAIPLPPALSRNARRHRAPRRNPPYAVVSGKIVRRGLIR